jgi:hypothetical protein
VGAASLTHPIAPKNSMHVRWKAVKLAGPIVPISSQIGNSIKRLLILALMFDD